MNGFASSRSTSTRVCVFVCYKKDVCGKACKIQRVIPSFTRYFLKQYLLFKSRWCLENFLLLKKEFPSSWLPYILTPHLGVTLVTFPSPGLGSECSTI